MSHGPPFVWQSHQRRQTDDAFHLLPYFVGPIAAALCHRPRLNLQCLVDGRSILKVVQETVLPLPLCWQGGDRYHLIRGDREVVSVHQWHSTDGCRPLATALLRGVSRSYEADCLVPRFGPARRHYGAVLTVADHLWLTDLLNVETFSLSHETVATDPAHDQQGSRWC